MKGRTSLAYPVQLRLCLLDLVLNYIVPVELIEESLVIKLFGKVSVFEYLKAEGSRGGLKSEVNVYKLSFGISNRVTINSHNQLYLYKPSIVT